MTEVTTIDSQFTIVEEYPITQKKVVYDSGVIAEGTFIGDKFIRGKLTYSDGAVCEGDFNENRMLHGKNCKYVKHKTTTYSVYIEGEFTDGHLVNGAKKTHYVGDGRLDLWTEYTGKFDTSGNLVKGKYITDLVTREGEFEFKDDCLYLKKGKETMNDVVHEGEFKNGSLIKGKKTAMYVSGSPCTYEGEFEGGALAKGTMTHPIFGTFTGEFNINNGYLKKGVKFDKFRNITYEGEFDNNEHLVNGKKIFHSLYDFTKHYSESKPLGVGCIIS